MAVFLASSLNYAENFNIIYFDPDGNLVKIADILSSGKKYFSSIDSSVNFIVIGNINVLETELENIKPRMMIVNSLYFASNKAKMQLKPLLIFVKDGRNKYTKKIVQIGNSIKSVTDLTNKTLASSSSKEEINKIFSYELSATKLLSVPRDIDAILALEFGQVDAAIVTDNSIKAFSVISPVDSEQLKVIFETREIFFPVGVSTKYSYKGAIYSKILKSFKEIKNNKLGTKFLNSMLFTDIQTDENILSLIK